MKNWKKWAGSLLALALMMGTLTGCSGGTREESSEAGTASGEASQATAAYDYSQGLDEEGNFAGVTALDYVALPDYRNIQAPESATTISDETLDAELAGILADYATTKQVTDRAVKDGDTLSIDYVGSVDGVEFDGGNTHGNGTVVTIGVTSYIDDFLEQIIGHMPGETFDVNVTFPTPYENNPDLSGKDAVFVTTVNFIQETVSPELTDEFAAEHFKDSDGWTTAEQLREGVRARLSREAAVDSVWEQVQAEASISQVPESVISYHKGLLESYYQSMATQYGMELNDFLSSYMGVANVEELISQNQSVINSNASTSLLLQALCEDMEFHVSDEALNKYLSDELGVAEPENVKSYYGEPYLRLLAKEGLVKEALVEE